MRAVSFAPVIAGAAGFGFKVAAKAYSPPADPIEGSPNDLYVAVASIPVAVWPLEAKTKMEEVAALMRSSAVRGFFLSISTAIALTSTALAPSHRPSPGEPGAGL